MNSEAIKLLDPVTLLCDLPASGLVKGQVGTVVEVYEPNAFEVEFVDQKGRTYALETLKAEQLMALHYNAISA